MKTILLLCIRIYQLSLNPLLRFFAGGQPICRYTPSCSHYFAQALQRHGTIRGTFLGLKRILRCHPWGGSGYDPIPERKKRTPQSTSRSQDH